MGLEKIDEGHSLFCLRCDTAALGNQAMKKLYIVIDRKMRQLLFISGGVVSKYAAIYTPLTAL
jgi:hypothetical protein